MKTAREFELKQYAKPLHEYTEEQMKLWAEAIVNDSMADRCEVRTSELGTHIYVDFEINGKEITIEPTMMGEEIKDRDELYAALKKEWDSRERSRAYVRGEVDSKEFEGFKEEIDDEYERD